MRRVLLAVVLILALAGCAGVVSDDGPRTTERTEVTVVRVVDGDTVEVEYPNGTRETVRLLGVDTPEVHAENDLGEFEGVPDTEAGRECLRDWGHRAGEFARAELGGESVTLVIDPESDRRGGYGRLLAYVDYDGGRFNERLVEEGYARLYDTTFADRDRYAAAEDRARENGTGLWECATR
ncbi:nuclease [Halostella sp. JP-L12]|uniref:thermonuclease family protein n=1 Tax=Halostella TaxID=1843185 RepID=UPI000EF84D88|nr:MULTISPECIES: thermonuclease family protein [Halostella]NHN46827.1 nuclease [Halostella sp. JP-L12]